MEKQFLKRKLPELVIIEGFLKMGKTLLIDYVENLNGLIKINEPDHLNYSIKDNISEWYKKEHMKRMDVASDNVSKEKKVIMERSLLSNISYQYAVSGHISSEYLNWLDQFNKKFKDVRVVFLYGGGEFIIKQSAKIKDWETANLVKNKYFKKRYIEFYRKILPEYINAVDFIKVDKHNKFKKKNEIFSKFYKNFPFLEKDFSTCASAVAYYKGKILLLYDKNYKHYVLPQGHQEMGESLKQTVIREIMEETGFDEIKVVKKIKKYQYHYPTKIKIIYKHIHVYLVKILSKSKSKKALSDHENYSNNFFLPSESISKAKWEQDKDIIRIALEYIKKAPTQ